MSDELVWVLRSGGEGLYSEGDPRGTGSTKYTPVAPSDTDEPTEREKVLDEVFTNLADQGWDVAMADDPVKGVSIDIQPVPSDTDREELAGALAQVFGMGTLPNLLREADAVLAILAALPIPATGETEWEYGIRDNGDDEPFTDVYPSIQAMLDEFDATTLAREGEQIVRRVKAGPWIEVAP